MRKEKHVNENKPAKDRYTENERTQFKKWLKMASGVKKT
jgi:hypothetical protein